MQLRPGIAAAFLGLTASGLLRSLCAFSGAPSRSRVHPRSRVARAARATGRSRRCPDNLPGGAGLWVQDADEDRPFYGWSQELGKWVEWPRDDIKKWWQQPGYLTPNGYRQNPVWNINDYQLCVLEQKFAFIEARLTKKLKLSGMTIEEIRARAEVFEFMESSDQPKLTDKMMFLLQVKALHDGREDELIDLQEGVSTFLKSDAPSKADGQKPLFSSVYDKDDPDLGLLGETPKRYSRKDYERATGKKVELRSTQSVWDDDYWEARSADMQKWPVKGMEQQKKEEAEKERKLEENAGS